MQQSVAHTPTEPDLGLFDNVTFPSWFPGTRLSLNDKNVISITAQTFSKFRDLPKEKIIWMYQFFFNQANVAATRNRRTPRTLGFYRQFTPPWYSGSFRPGTDRLVKLDAEEVRMKRALRKKEGLQTIRLTLAAFYDIEATFAKSPLDYILSNEERLMQRYPFTKSTMTKRRRATQTLPQVLQQQATVSSAEHGEPQLVAATAHLPSSGQYQGPGVRALSAEDTDDQGPDSNFADEDMPGPSLDDSEPSSTAAAAGLL